MSEPDQDAIVNAQAQLLETSSAWGGPPRQWNIHPLLGSGYQHGYEAGFTAGAEGCLKVMDDRDHWIRLWNRLEAAISHHKKATAGFATDADEALYAARARILKAAAEPSRMPLEHSVEQEGC